MTHASFCGAQALYAYFTGCELQEALQRPWPRHSVLELTPVRNSHLFGEASIDLESGPVLDALVPSSTPSAAGLVRPLPPS